ncbi:MAG: gluconate 2-dehydrogenase gamma chain [Thermoproteota archaeon]|nr:gluconate 2-dehydrogenase gamma chain [Thermoproteota archaeon]
MTKNNTTTRRQFIKYLVAGAIGAGAVTVVEYPILNNQIQNDNKQISDLNTQVSSLQNKLDTSLQHQGFLTLNPDEQTLVEAIVETMIPTDSNGPGGKEAGVIYFIDNQLAGSYGKGGNMYLQGPFVQPNQGALTVQSITYSGGTIAPRLQAGTSYQYPFNLREYWQKGLAYIQAYSQSAYGGKFDTLSSDNRTKVLQDLYDNKPINFLGPQPAEFFNELYDMVIAGFMTDPLYGGNIGMASWQLMGSTGVNDGQDQGYTTKQLMVATTPTRLSPKSLGDIQKTGM